MMHELILQLPATALCCHCRTNNHRASSIACDPHDPIQASPMAEWVAKPIVVGHGFPLVLRNVGIRIADILSQELILIWRIERNLLMKRK